jgi:hypothetical protein
MPDGNGLNFDITLPSDTSSVRYGAKEIRALRTQLKDWSGADDASAIFKSNTAKAELKNESVTSDNLTAASGSASVISTAVDLTSPTSVYTAASFNAKGQAVKASRVTLDQIVALSPGTAKLSSTNLQPSATGGQFLRTNAAATSTEWATNAIVSNWDTSQGTTFLEVPNLGQAASQPVRDAGVSTWNGSMWDGSYFFLCGTTGLKYSCEFYSWKAISVTASSILRHARYVKNTNASNVSSVVVGSSGGNGIVYTDTSSGSFTLRTKSSGNWPELYSSASDGANWVFVGAAGTIYRFQTLAGSGNLSPETVTPAVGAAQTFNDVAYGDGTFVVVGNTGTLLKFSPGNTNASSVSPGGTGALRGVVFAPHLAFGTSAGKWIVVGDNGIVHLSTDSAATSWESQTIGGGSFNLNSVAVGNGVILAVGDNGNIWRSTDGKVWTNVSSKVYRAIATPTVSAVTATLNRVTFGGGCFLIVGPSTVLFSGDLPIPTWKIVSNSEFSTTAGNAIYWRYLVSYALPHNLSSTPALVRAYLVCLEDQSGIDYYAGDLVPVSADNPASLQLAFNNSYFHVQFPLPYDGTTPPTETLNPRYTLFDRTYNSLNIGQTSPGTFTGALLDGVQTTGINPRLWRMRIVATSIS